MALALSTPMSSARMSSTLVPLATVPLGMAPSPSVEVRLVSARRPDHAIYVRRRLAVGILAAAVLTLIGVSAHAVLADRGGAPASVPAVEPVAGAAPVHAAAPVAAAGTPYLVQPGETLWAIADAWHGATSFDAYLDALVAQNGGPRVAAGTLLTLP